MSNDLDKFTKCDIFTPDHISKIMASKLTSRGTLLEPSVGTGNLLKHLDLKAYDEIHAYELKSDYLKMVSSENVTKFNCDFLKTSTDVIYNNIIMNPPYIKVQDLSIEYRKFLKTSFPMLRSGMIDIYYAFILKCLEKLDPTDGIMVAIIPNTYLFNKSAINLRKYLFENRYVSEIIDYNSEKVFKNVSVYCCVTVFTKTPKSSLTYNGKEILYDDFVNSPTCSIFDVKSSEKVDIMTLKSICKMSNGLATLRDKIYIHSEKLYDEPCWQQVITNGTTKKYIIYPYIRETKQIIPEDQFKQRNPKTYDYLLNNKDELMMRDKGNKVYSSWYAYGRTQSISGPKTKSIYLPTFINPQNISTSMMVDEPMLFQGCICIEPNNIDDIDKIKNSIVANIDRINELSSKRSGGWITLSTTLLYQTPVI